MSDRMGRVLLVGAGPGSADLLTLRAVRALGEADVVLADALVSEDVRAFASPSARFIEVGKRGHQPSTPQDYINRLMERLAREGNCVVRLKGGDPSIFGRVAEERAWLEARGVSVEVVPGVTTASAAAAEFGFSLTTRGQARRVLFATGRTLEGASTGWETAADGATTICLYMGCGEIAGIARCLMEAGLAATTPAIAAINVSRADSRLVTSTLSALPVALADIPTGAPVFIAIGEACAEAMDARANLPAQSAQQRSRS